MSAIRNPVDPLEFVERWNPLEGFVSGVKYTILFDILRKKELDSFDCREGLLDDPPQCSPGWFRSLLGEV
jgi:hypothetical protein